jgi:hypothetical protein
MPKQRPARSHDKQCASAKISFKSGRSSAALPREGNSPVRGQSRLRVPSVSAALDASPVLTPSVDEVRTFRQRAIDNGHRLVRVRSLLKAPLPNDWQHGAQPELLLDVRPTSLNTGLLLAGLRCVDIDVDDPQLVIEIIQAAAVHLPLGALIRRRVGSPRLAMLYRAAIGQPTKLVVTGPKGKIEILGVGSRWSFTACIPPAPRSPGRGGKALILCVTTNL